MMKAVSLKGHSDMAPSEQHDSTGERWLSYYARAGYGAKGVIYSSSGLLALMESLDLRQGETVGSTGALRTIARQPFGQIMIATLAVSLMGYVSWRFIQAAIDPEHSGCDASDVLRRLGYFLSGLVYTSLAFSAVKILMHADSKEGKTAEDWAFELMQQPFGQWLVGAGGALFIGIGGYYLYRAIKAEFRKRFKLHQMSDAEKTWATVVGRVGIAARGIVYAVVGSYGIKAAWTFDPQVIKTTEEALAVFNNNPADEWILGTLGVGFIAYGIHMAFQAKCRSIDPL